MEVVISILFNCKFLFLRIGLVGPRLLGYNEMFSTINGQAFEPSLVDRNRTQREVENQRKCGQDGLLRFDRRRGHR